MKALTSAAGPRAVHIVLSEQMEQDIRAASPALLKTVVVGNATMVEPALLQCRSKGDIDVLALGHLSNLTRAKGIEATISLTQKLLEQGTATRLVLAGPLMDEFSSSQVRRAEKVLGDRFQYLGELDDAGKIAFYEEISHFVFPSQYVNEAVPMVLYEALAAGVPCLATPVGSIPQQLAHSGSFVSTRPETFVEESLDFLTRPRTTVARMSIAARKAYLSELKRSTDALDGLFGPEAS
ncbi:glycosyltransferase family 4 protein [Microbacterium sp. UBA837]|uniref:glycosyltransferase family 4 protein n=1 Tax=Microbacterium sp. UBA837 TaxID=1946956 RepID=UPI0025FD5CE3|nr:glycosyltransferase family 4 protein [Microbacterium sp. UBA837]|tara:strand:- start:8586 stop:9299 length:714 start_codon:yes stop_codon:yes gene_type:complete